MGSTGKASAQQICAHPDFPHQTNVEFVRIVNPNEIEIRIFERGVGPTTFFGHRHIRLGHAALALSGCASPLARRRSRRRADRGVGRARNGVAT